MLSDKFNSFYIVGVSFKWTIWDWGKTSNDRQLLRVQEDMLGTRRESLVRTIHIAMYNSESRIEQLEKSLQTDSSLVVLRQRIAERSEFKLNQGTMSATDYVNDVNASTQAKLQLELHKVQLVQEKINYITLKGSI